MSSPNLHYFKIIKDRKNIFLKHVSDYQHLDYFLREVQKIKINDLTGETYRVCPGLHGLLDQALVAGES